MNETVTSTYREEAPPLGWRRAVRCIWEQRISAGAVGYQQRVLPDGHADLLVTDGGNALVVGPATGVTLPVLAPGATVRGVRLASDRVRAVLGVPASELTDRIVPLAGLAPGRLVRAVEDAVGAGDARARAVLDRWLAAAEPDARAAAATRALWHHPGLEVSSVAAWVGLSSRQLRRALLAEVGLGPKTLQRIGRLQRFLALARSGPGRGLAELAADAGFADQPHLSREVRVLAGLTPAALLAEQLS